MWHGQNNEDERIAKLLPDYPKNDGFYIDVGAWEPTLESVTKHFYDLGWSGINVEPIPYYADKLRAERPRDIVVEAVVSRHYEVGGRREITWVHDTGLSSVIPFHARKGIERGFPSEKITVDVTSLSQICDAHVTTGKVIDFLKIDVEGYETETIEGMDWLW
ncbi:MAG: hypothetical protein NVSMB14_01310 [Isosphaeraceae bacterium]